MTLTNFSQMPVPFTYSIAVYQDSTAYRQNKASIHVHGTVEKATSGSIEVYSTSGNNSPYRPFSGALSGLFIIATTSTL